MTSHPESSAASLARSGWEEPGIPTFVVPAGLAVVSVLASLLAGGPGSLAAQSPVEAMVAECVERSEGRVAECEDAALLLQAAFGGIGFLATAGGALPASPSTAGWRLEGRPRIVLDGGFMTSTFRFPEPDRTLPGRSDDRKTLLGARATATVGIFEGFSLLPTVGGVLALDGVATLRYLRLPGEQGNGFNESMMSWGAGVRLGLLRESFSLPGVTVTGTHHRPGASTYLARVSPDESAGDFVAVRLRPKVTSVRAELGKDLLALGITLGGAWDRYAGTGRIATDFQLGFPADPERVWVSSSDLVLERFYLFLGVNFTWVVAQVAGEVGWGRAPSRFVEFEGSGPFRADSPSLQGALTVRITY